MTSHSHDHRASSSRKRSVSPHRDTILHKDVKRYRSRSPSHHGRHHRQDRSTAINLPLNARALHRHDLEKYRALFADYLDIQKRLDIHDLSEDEVKGRWKSFLGKWNRGELAEGWYDPETKQKADGRYAEALQSDRFPHRKDIGVGSVDPKVAEPLGEHEDDNDDDDDDYGPTLPDTAPGKSLGPAIPRLQDLQHRQELAEEDQDARVADLRYERKLDRVSQKERLEELVPRAEPGSRERQLEKRRDAAAANRDFRDAKDGGAVEEVGEGELMGDGDGIEGFKAKAKARERQKNEREIRKEEVLRARAAEREERMTAHRNKEEKTMDMLRAMAKQRFG